MPEILSSNDYIERILATRRPREDDILAFYEHRIGGICNNPRLMLLPLDDHLAHRGDGIFETLLYRHGRLYELEAHLKRMQSSAAGMFLEPPCAWSELAGIITAVARAGGEPDGLLRILIGRGPGGFGIDPRECPQSSLYVVAYRFTPKPESWYANGLRGFRTSIPAKQGYLAKIKNANYLPNVLMTREAGIKGYDVPFCYDEEGYLAESAIANLCMLDQSGTLLVPEFSNALAGTTISRLLALLKRGMPEQKYAFRKITEAEVKAARELMILGTTIGCASVVSYEDQPIGPDNGADGDFAKGSPGPVAKRLRELLEADLANGDPVPGLAG